MLWTKLLNGIVPQYLGLGTLRLYLRQNEEEGLQYVFTEASKICGCTAAGENLDLLWSGV